jgi:hypothetical protein
VLWLRKSIIQGSHKGKLDVAGDGLEGRFVCLINKHGRHTSAMAALSLYSDEEYLYIELYVRCIMGLMTCKEAYLACGYSSPEAIIKGWNGAYGCFGRCLAFSDGQVSVKLPDTPNSEPL